MHKLMYLAFQVLMKLGEEYPSSSTSTVLLTKAGNPSLGGRINLYNHLEDGINACNACNVYSRYITRDGKGGIVWLQPNSGFLGGLEINGLSINCSLVGYTMAWEYCSSCRFLLICLEQWSLMGLRRVVQVQGRWLNFQGKRTLFAEPRRGLHCGL